LPEPVLVNVGCRLNAAELDEFGRWLGPEVGNVVVVNSCTVTVAADRDTRKAVARARREHPGAAVVLMGCYVNAHPGYGLAADLVIPNGLKPVPVVGEGPGLASASASASASVDPPGVRRSRYVLKVQDGCDNRCTFCIVWQARGRSLSRAGGYVEATAQAAAAAGYRELVLTGVDLGSYRGGLGPLVERLLRVAAPARLRLSSVDPSHVDSSLLELLGHPRLCPHLHLPLQSGSDRVLARMRRRYDVAVFERVVAEARTLCPDLALTGDVMVGFPGETDDDFQRTLDVVERSGFSGLHVFRFSARPRTPAARYADQVPLEIARERSRVLISLGERLAAEYAARFEGRRLRVVWDRVVGGRIRGVAENYLVARADAAGRRPGQLEEVVWRTASSAP
jgi:threonylcarbamoyladenosine tRNA methylthiotransferase MtaB